MKEKNIFIFLLAAFLMITFFSCVPSKPTEDVEILPSERLIKRLEANRRKIKSFEGIGNININTSSINADASFKITIQRPDTMYLEIYGPFGIDLAKALVTNGNFTFYDVIHNTVYKGRNDSDILEKIFKVNLSFGELIDAFTGSVNLTSRLSEQPSKYDVNYDKYVLTYFDPPTNQKSMYIVDIRDLTVTDYQLFSASDSNQVMLEGAYSKFKMTDNVLIPMNTKVVNKLDDQKITIDYRKVEVNKRNIRINLVIPDDAKVVEWQ